MSCVSSKFLLGERVNFALGENANITGDAHRVQSLNAADENALQNKCRVMLLIASAVIGPPLLASSRGLDGHWMSDQLKIAFMASIVMAFACRRGIFRDAMMLWIVASVIST